MINNKNLNLLLKKKITYHAITIRFFEFPHLRCHFYPKVYFIGILKKKKIKHKHYEIFKD